MLYGVLVLKCIIQDTFCWVPKNITHILPYFRIPIIYNFVFSWLFAIIMHNYVGTIEKSSYITQINFLTKIITTIFTNFVKDSQENTSNQGLFILFLSALYTYSAQCTHKYLTRRYSDKFSVMKQILRGELFSLSYSTYQSKSRKNDNLKKVVILG